MSNQGDLSATNGPGSKTSTTQISKLTVPSPWPSCHLILEGQFPGRSWGKSPECQTPRQTRTWAARGSASTCQTTGSLPETSKMLVAKRHWTVLPVQQLLKSSVAFLDQKRSIFLAVFVLIFGQQNPGSGSSILMKNWKNTTEKNLSLSDQKCKLLTSRIP